MTDSQSPHSTHYRNRLQPWCIIRHLPKMQRITVARFRARQEAEAYLKVLRSLTPNFSYSLVFDVGNNSVKSADLLADHHLADGIHPLTIAFERSE